MTILLSEEELLKFIRQSNLIEGMGEPTEEEISAHVELLSNRQIWIENLNRFVQRIANASLREHAGMNVRVGSYTPPPGGAEIRFQLGGLLSKMNRMRGMVKESYEFHLEYESLHPYMDGNGRSGRALWLWQSMQETLPKGSFLHKFYYDTLRYKAGR